VRAQGETFPKQTVITVELSAKELVAQAVAVCATASTPGPPVGPVALCS
jgi:hypothetical protein